MGLVRIRGERVAPAHPEMIVVGTDEHRRIAHRGVGASQHTEDVHRGGALRRRQRVERGEALVEHGAAAARGGDEPDRHALEEAAVAGGLETDAAHLRGDHAGGRRCAPSARAAPLERVVAQGTQQPPHAGLRDDARLGAFGRGTSRRHRRRAREGGEHEHGRDRSDRAGQTK